MVAFVFSGTVDSNSTADPTLTPKFKYAPIISVDVGRRFSTFKSILSYRRRRIKIEYLHQLVIVCYYHNRKD